MGLIKPAYSCMLTLAMDLAGGKWKMVILWQLRGGVVRFSVLKRQLDGITQKMLTQQLRELEDSGLVRRTVYPVVPPKVEYGLTAEGEKCIPALELLCRWSTEYAAAHGIAQATCRSGG